MLKKLLFLFVLLLALYGCAAAEVAPELTSKCKCTAGAGRGSFSDCRDNNYKTYWKGGSGKNGWVEVTAPEGKPVSLVYIQWYEFPMPWQVQVKDESGNWATVAESGDICYNDSIRLPEPAGQIRICLSDAAKGSMDVAELHLYGEGDCPANVQKWLPSVEKAELMVVVAHPDDEVLWMGGTLPFYAGQEGRDTVVCMLVPTMPYRRIELLDCLWTCGVRTYPVWGKFPDAYSSTLSDQYKHWNEETLYKLITGWYRRFKPDVVVTHDKRGEYGHGAHKACFDACTKALKFAANEKKYPDSAREYGTWDVPKLYVHLWGENTVDMDWRQPLDFFDGKTAFDVACEAFRCHRSQQKTDYHVEDWGRYDCSLFGLYRSLVGDDTEKLDFFENIGSLP